MRTYTSADVTILVEVDRVRERLGQGGLACAGRAEWLHLMFVRFFPPDLRFAAKDAAPNES